MIVLSDDLLDRKSIIDLINEARPGGRYGDR
jgi:hypothetical protein